MYAIFEDGSRQYKVSEGDVVRVDFRRDETNKEERHGVATGTRLEFKRVLLYRHGDELKVGQPVLDGMRIIGEVIDHPSVKTHIGKYRRRKNYRRHRGHRQFWTAVRVRHILQPGQDVPVAQTPVSAPTPAPTPETPAQTPAPATT